MKSYTRVLTIAGSDSGGGAGIQADLKTFAACGCYGMSAITALTAQNTCGVTAIHPVPVPFLEAQLRAVFDDIGVDAVKIGMLHSAPVIACVAEILKEYGCMRVVLDPVMVATSGDRLIEEDGVAAMRDLLFPVAGLLTPNIPEAQLLAGRRISTVRDLPEVCRDLVEVYGTPVLLKGGHLGGDDLEDVLVTGESGELRRYQGRRLATRNTHGTGCTLSSAIAAFWAKGDELDEAVARAERYLQRAVAAGAGYGLGGGHGPVHHFHDWWR